MNVIIAGARRSGTTSLYNYLGQHPKVRLAGPDPRREVHFFDRDDHWLQGRAWYVDQFSGRRLGHLGVDKSPTYLQFLKAPVRASQVVPAANVLIMLRHPIDRAYSDFAKRRKEGYEQRRWGTAIKEELRGYKKRSPFWMSQRHLYGYLERSDYLPQVTAWLEHFGDQVMVLQFEHFIRNVQVVMDEVFQWLGLLSVGVNARKSWQRVNYGPMKKRHRLSLRDYFRPRVITSDFPFSVGSYDWWGR